MNHILLNYIFFATFVLDTYTFIHKEWLIWLNDHWVVEAAWVITYLLSILYMLCLFVWALNNANFIV